MLTLLKGKVKVLFTSVVDVEPIDGTEFLVYLPNVVDHQIERVKDHIENMSMWSWDRKARGLHDELTLLVKDRLTKEESKKIFLTGKAHYSGRRKGRPSDNKYSDLILPPRLTNYLEAERYIRLVEEVRDRIKSEKNKDLFSEVLDSVDGTEIERLFDCDIRTKQGMVMSCKDLNISTGWDGIISVELLSDPIKES